MPPIRSTQSSNRSCDSFYSADVRRHPRSLPTIPSPARDHAHAQLRHVPRESAAHASAPRDARDQRAHGAACLAPVVGTVGAATKQRAGAAGAIGRLLPSDGVHDRARDPVVARVGVVARVLHEFRTHEKRLGLGGRVHRDVTERSEGGEDDAGVSHAVVRETGREAGVFSGRRRSPVLRGMAPRLNLMVGDLAVAVQSVDVHRPRQPTRGTVDEHLAA